MRRSRRCWRTAWKFSRVEEQNADHLDLAAVLKLIAGRGITRLMVEGGPTVAASLVAADLVDEAILFRSPTSVGAAGIDALEGLPLTALTQSPRLKALAAIPVGDDMCDFYGRR